MITPLQPNNSYNIKVLWKKERRKDAKIKSNNVDNVFFEWKKKKNIQTRNSILVAFDKKERKKFTFRAITQLT